jgi:hypothetical protein
MKIAIHDSRLGENAIVTDLNASGASEPHSVQEAVITDGDHRFVRVGEWGNMHRNVDIVAELYSSGTVHGKATEKLKIATRRKSNATQR